MPVNRNLLKYCSNCNLYTNEIAPVRIGKKNNGAIYLETFCSVCKKKNHIKN